MTDNLILGTVQLGMPYGVNNSIGKPDFDSACEIVNTAFRRGVTRFDTAQAYGDSEEVLGRIFKKYKICSQVKVYSKLHPTLNLLNSEVVEESVNNSLNKLKINQLEGLFLHNEEGMQYWDRGLGDSLRGLVAKGKVKLIGVSFYTPQKAIAALNVDGVDIIQVPANILDQRFENYGVFSEAKKCNKDIFVRSVLLQGLLLMPLELIPESMKSVSFYLRRIEQIARDLSLSREELVLGYAATRWPGAFVLFGAESVRQVIDNLSIFSKKSILKIDDGIFENIPENVLNPALWPKT